jgi:hypothetical protein
LGGAKGKTRLYAMPMVRRRQADGRMRAKLRLPPSTPNGQSTRNTSACHIKAERGYHTCMADVNFKALDPAELMPIPDVPESHGPRNGEDQRVHDLVTAGLNSGEPIPVDEGYFARLRARIASFNRR